MRRQPRYTFDGTTFFDLNDAQITETRINPNEILRAEKAAAEQVRAVFRAGPSTYNPACCGVEEGALCASDCDRRLVALARQREAFEAVASANKDCGWTADWIEKIYDGARPSRERNPSALVREIRTMVDGAREEARRKMGRCDHFMLPDACGPSCDPLEIASGEELNDIGERFGVLRLPGAPDDVYRDAVRLVRGRKRRNTALGPWHNLAEAKPLTMAQIVEARDQLRRAEGVRVQLPPPRAPTPAEIRAENLRVGAELAKNPPAWAYPLGWTLAVSAYVEASNNRATPLDMNNPVIKQTICTRLDQYHRARLRGATVGDAESEGAHDEWALLLWRAYERGRGAPGGERLGRPA